jgi:hypothetical protein
MKDCIEVEKSKIVIDSCPAPIHGTLDFEETLDQAITYMNSSARRLRIYICLQKGDEVVSWEFKEFVRCAYGPQYLSSERSRLPIPILRRRSRKKNSEGKTHFFVSYYIAPEWLELTQIAIERVVNL